MEVQKAPLVVHGMGGLGKSMLLARLLRDLETRRTCPDGAVWIQMSQDASQLDGLKQLAKHVSRLLGKPKPENCRDCLELIKDSGVLIIVDDVWQVEQVISIHNAVRSSSSSRLLISSRKSSIIDALSAEKFAMPFLQGDEALQLLGNWAETSLAELKANSGAMSVAAWCGVGEGKKGGVPLALRAIGSLRRGQEGRPWPSILKLLETRKWDMQRGGPIDAEYHADQEEYRTVFGALHVSLDELEPDDQKRCVQLGIFPEDQKVPLTILRALWNVDDVTETEDTVVELVKCSLVIEGGAKEGFVRLHDLQRDFCLKSLQRTATTEQVDVLHATVIRSVGSGPAEGEGSDSKPVEIGYQTTQLEEAWNGPVGVDRLLYHLGKISEPMLPEPLKIIEDTCVHSIDLFSLPLTCLPGSIVHLVHLVSLKLNDCEQLVKLPASFERLVRLEFLDLSGCKQLVSLNGCGLEKLASLTEMDCYNCERLTELPPRIDGLARLKQLSFNGCKMLTDLPPALAELPS